MSRVGLLPGDKLGESSASAAFGTTIGSPILRSRAASTNSGRLGATSMAIQRYDNLSGAAQVVYTRSHHTLGLRYHEVYLW